MQVEALVRKIYDFEGNKEEWLQFEKAVMQEIENYSEEENEYLVESEAMESLLMVCDGIRYGKN